MIKLINQYKKLKVQGYKPKFENFIGYFFGLSFFGLFGLSLSICSILKVSGFVMLVMSALSIVLSIVSTLLFELLSDKYELIEFRLLGKIYKGKLSDIFDLEDNETTFILNNSKEAIEDNLLEHKGIPIDFVLSLINQIYGLKQKNQETLDYENAKINKQEEKEALIKAGTKIGSIIQELRTLKS